MSIEATEDEMIRDYDLRYIWTCISCGYEYEAPPGCNEALPCSMCGAITVRSGETYLSEPRY